jgi:hypothetical protein
MISNVTFKGYESVRTTTKEDKLQPPLVNIYLEAIDSEKIDIICEAIQKAYEFGYPISWSINIEHEYM